MKYDVGNIVLLNDGNTVYILSVDKIKKEYHVSDTDNNGLLSVVTENEILMLLT